MKRSNAIALVVGGAAVLAAVAWALRPEPVAVEVVEVRRASFEKSVSDDGRTRVRDRYVVSAPLGGRVARITLRAGDAVAAGQEVARLSPAAPALLDARTESEMRERVGAAQAQQQRAQAEVRRLEAQRDQARADLARQAKLAGEGFVAPTAREQAELALRVTERGLESARFGEDAAGHDVAQARAALARYRGGAPASAWSVTSPVAGAVLKVAQESEAVVAMGTPFVEVGDPRALEIVVDVLSQEAIALRPGMPARIEVGGNVAALSARIRRVEPAAFTKVSALGVEEQRVNVVLDFDDPPDALPTLGDGFRVDAHILTLRVENALVAPVGALFRDGDGWALFVVAEGRAAKRAVKVGARNPTQAWIEQGLAAGERIVVYPSDALSDGSRVREVAALR
ncbi:MAG TPA: efflux RND transporter periplasmic adaptor subunit [Usitatibacter sp.]|nr:efflux RND transporter periplasmic adaptor subunit [Usitatibacter sp.]